MASRPSHVEIGNGSGPGKTRQSLAIQAMGLGVAFGDVEVLREVDLEIRQGQVFGLIGPSGCGKTTFLRLAGGLAVPTEGALRVFDEAPRNFGPRQQARLGYVPQQFALYGNLSVEQNARFVAGLYGMGWRHRRRRIRELLEYYDLWSVRKRRASDISGGMLRRLSIACAVMHQPDLVLIDEPTTGLDPLLRTKVWEHLKNVRDGGATVLVTTQYIDEALNCDRIAVMRAGSIIAVGHPDDVRKMAGGQEALEMKVTGLTPAVVDRLWSIRPVSRVKWNERDELIVLTSDSAAATPLVTNELRAHGVEVHEVRAYIPTFEDAFLTLMQSRKDER